MKKSRRCFGKEKGHDFVFSPKKYQSYGVLFLCGSLPRPDPGPQQFCNTPCLRNTPFRSEWWFGIENLIYESYASLVKV
jgi:hypothetical protein